MTAKGRFRSRRVILGFVLGVGITGGLVQFVDRSGPPLLVNESPSLPRGLYVRHPGAERNLQATVGLPQPSSARAYLAGIGMPPDVLLIKRIAAREGDRVCRIADRITAGNRHVEVLQRDRRGVRLRAWDGCRTLGPGEVFVLGDTRTSFDSRYFGPVKETEITGVYREVVRW